MGEGLHGGGGAEEESDNGEANGSERTLKWTG